jgi:proteic killer suppression protein
MELACRGDSELWRQGNREDIRSDPFPEIQERAHHKLVAIHEAESLENLRNPPGNRLEVVRGDLQGLHSIRINNQWRIVFRWEGKDAHDVMITDYH